MEAQKTPEHLEPLRKEVDDMLNKAMKLSQKLQKELEKAGHPGKVAYQSSFGIVQDIGERMAVSGGASAYGTPAAMSFLLIDMFHNHPEVLQCAKNAIMHLILEKMESTPVEEILSRLVSSKPMGEA